MNDNINELPRVKYRNLMLLHLVFLFFSASGILAKYASAEEFFSSGFMLLYGAQLAVLFIYSVLWQLILRNISLTIAYANRAVTIIWGMLWGVLLFNESISPAKVIAAAFIAAGIVVIGNEHE